MFCGHCGHNMKETHNFCTKCGVKKTEVEEAQIEVEENAEEVVEGCGDAQEEFSLALRKAGDVVREFLRSDLMTDDEHDLWEEEVKSMCEKVEVAQTQHDNKLIGDGEFMKTIQNCVYGLKTLINTAATKSEEYRNWIDEELTKSEKDDDYIAFGMTWEDYSGLDYNSPFEDPKVKEAFKKWKESQKLKKQQRRELIKKHHPDRGGTDKELKKILDETED